MDINETNKKLYESAFIGNGEYGVVDGGWKPSINENEIEEWCGRTDDDGNERWVPATPLGYRDYEISRAEGLKNIFAQEEVTATFDYDAFHSIKKEEVPFKQYDKIVYDDTPYIVVGDDDEKFYIVDECGGKYYVNYAGNQSTEL